MEQLSRLRDEKSAKESRSVGYRNDLLRRDAKVNNQNTGGHSPLHDLT